MLENEQYYNKFYTVSAVGNKEALHTKDNDIVIIEVGTLEGKNINVINFENKNIP